MKGSSRVGNRWAWRRTTHLSHWNGSCKNKLPISVGLYGISTTVFFKTYRKEGVGFVGQAL